VSPLRKKVPSDENVSMFFPTPAGRLAVTIHAPTRLPPYPALGCGDAQAARSKLVDAANKAKNRNHRIVYTAFSFCRMST
jgi:hypothetical protein